MSAEITFTTGLAFLDESLAIAGASDSLEAYAPFARVVQYSETTPPHWWKTDKDWRVCSIAYFGPSNEDFDDFVTLSEEGHIQYFGEHDSLLEKIPGAGVYSDDAEGWGYLSDLQQIGEHLYACGYSGQVYKRLGPNEWVHMDEGILQARGLKEGHISAQVINGPHEQAIYLAGCENLPGYPVRVDFWNGQSWRALPLPETAERITNIYVESEQRIWMCGSNGTLLLGNADEGFKSLSSATDNQLFLSVCKFQNKIYLGSNLGLFVYDPANPEDGIQRVVTNLQPDLQDANIVDSVDAVLWSIGPKDIAKFDGNTWTRIDHPDNPPIR